MAAPFTNRRRVIFFIRSLPYRPLPSPLAPQRSHSFHEGITILPSLPLQCPNQNPSASPLLRFFPDRRKPIPLGKLSRPSGTNLVWACGAEPSPAPAVNRRTAPHFARHRDTCHANCGRSCAPGREDFP